MRPDLSGEGQGEVVQLANRGHLYDQGGEDGGE